MADRKVIAVIGATGSQGGGLANAILSDLDGNFACRAITRNPSGDKAQALKAEGAEASMRISMTSPALRRLSPVPMEPFA